MYEYPTFDIEVYDKTDLELLGVIIFRFIYVLGCEHIDSSLLMLSIRCRLLQITCYSRVFANITDNKTEILQ